MSLTSSEWQRVVDAIWVMKNTTLEAGQDAFGVGFKPYDYFVVKHAFSATDSRGDQGHYTEAFPNFHAAFILEFENSLLAIDPSISGLPYWETNTGNVFNSEYFGSAPGTGPGKVVIDGKFANFPINKTFDVHYWGTLSQGWNASVRAFSGSNGFLRGSHLRTFHVTRYGSPWSNPRERQAACMKVEGCFSAWHDCIDFFMDNMHDLGHIVIGGRSKTDDGDLTDTKTSPNDPIFWFVHANLDRIRMGWMAAHQGESSVYYGYKGSRGHCRIPDMGMGCPQGGIDILDVMSSGFPFTAGQLGLSGLPPGKLVTHGDALCHLGPATAPYTYADPSQ